MLDNGIDEFLLKNPLVNREEFLPYQIKYAKIKEELLRFWYSVKDLSPSEFNKKSETSIFSSIIVEAKKTQKHPVLLFEKLSKEEKIIIYKAFNDGF